MKKDIQFKLNKNYKDLYKEYLNGNSLKKIGKKIGISRHVISRFFKKKKLHIRTSKESHPKTGSTLNKTQKKIILKLLKKDVPLKKISKKLKISYGRLHFFLEEVEKTPGPRIVSIDKSLLENDYKNKRITIKNLGKKYGHDPKTIRKILKNSKVKMISASDRFKITVPELNSLKKKMNKNTLSLSLAAKKAGVSRYIFKQRLEDAGLRIRSSSREKQVVFNLKKKGFNFDFFKNLNTINSYWVGFILTDGSISGKLGKKLRLSISLSQRDIGHLKKIKKLLGAGSITKQDMSKYKFKRRDGLEIKGTKMASYQLSSTSLCNDLIKLGIKPRKTYSAKPHKKVENSKHFWRGVIDGDGHLSKLKNSRGVTSTRLDFGSASKQLILSYVRFLLKRRVKATIQSIRREGFNIFYIVTLTGKRARKIVRYLYLKSNYNSRLERKYKIADSWIMKL